MNYLLCNQILLIIFLLRSHSNQWQRLPDNHQVGGWTSSHCGAAAVWQAATATAAAALARWQRVLHEDQCEPRSRRVDRNRLVLQKEELKLINYLAVVPVARNYSSV